MQGSLAAQVAGVLADTVRARARVAARPTAEATSSLLAAANCSGLYRELFAQPLVKEPQAPKDRVGLLTSSSSLCCL